MKKFVSEFREFALKGSMFDMAIGVIMGGAVSKVVTSLVTNVFTPLIALLTGGGMNFDDKLFTINSVEFTYGVFITDVIDFLMTAFIIFIMVKGLNKLRKLNAKPEEETAPAEPEISSTDKLLQEILEELKKQK